ncbi:hypothetical protein RFI_25490 [Reticulomyxa filosa]|uniref:Uncharacterized protein n=1 Tax=Reticulomyxa filosa TaxID=46433 RepID=X6MD21_RETFI|nr:hypothetical protein RFI_25490 [Reticulomyxa filosa]|eukprot:ETO11888.1 hypothetical protein RFI_25490 [Reticulomyxa filosa]
MIIHKIYGRCLKLRTHVIDLACNYLYRIIHCPSTDHFNGVIELLQIICAIIPGLTVPIKDSWQKFLSNVLVPLHKVFLRCDVYIYMYIRYVLWYVYNINYMYNKYTLNRFCSLFLFFDNNKHKCRGLKKYWEQLTQCCVNYVAKDKLGAVVVLRGLLCYWPKQSPQKEEIFIMGVVNIINVLLNHQDGFDYSLYKPILITSAKQLTQSMISSRQPVAERAIAAWKEPSMQRLVDYDRKGFLPPLLEAFFQNRHYPNQQLRLASANVEKIYQSKDISYWTKMQQYLTKKEAKEREAEETIAKALAYGNVPPFPFKIGKQYTKPGISVGEVRINGSIRTDATQIIINSGISDITESDIGDNKLNTNYSEPPTPSEYTTDNEGIVGNGHVAINNNESEGNDVRKRPFDSFVIFTLETLNNVDYSPLLPNIKNYERDAAQKKSRCLTRTEQQVLR